MEGTVGRMISLNGTNWVTWKTKMEDLLYCKDLYGPIEGDKGKPVGTKDEDWNKLNRKTVGVIRQWIDDNVFHHVSTETTAHSLWKKLEELYDRKSATNKAFLFRKLVNLKYKDGGSVAEHLNDMKNIVNQLASMKIVFDDELQALMLLSSLPESWETLVVTVSNSASDGVVTMSQVTSSLLNEETRRKSASYSHSEALVVKDRGRSKSRSYHNRSKSRNNRDKSRESQGTPDWKKNIECHYCHKKGHMKRDCRKLKFKEENREKNGEKTEQKTTAVVSNGDLMVMYEDGCVNFTSQETSWVVDSGASFHVTSRVDFFSSYTKGEYGHVRMGNEGLSKIIGIGDICLETSLGCKLLLKNVRHVPDIRLNLISTGMLDDEGYNNHFGDGKWKLTKGSLVVAKGTKASSLYFTQGKIGYGIVNSVDDDFFTELWHKRLGHMSEKALNFLAKRQLLAGMKGTPLKTCVHCLAGKQTRISFRSMFPSRRSNVLDLVHSDVCGPMKVKSLGGSFYFVTFIDDHSRKVWAYTLKTKDQVLSVFKYFQAQVERETGRKLKCVRSDNGGEYLGPFDEYCNSLGIRHQRTVKKTPQQNGVAERMNRTIVERIRCMLSHAKLSRTFWGEAMRTAVDLINLSPSNPLLGDVPERVWRGKDVTYDHLKVFGCRAFVHIPKDERSKLDDKSKQCIFIGYGHDEFGYRLWDPLDKKLIRSRDVVFLEDQTIEDFGMIEKSGSSSSDLIDLEPSPPIINEENVEEIQPSHDVPNEEVSQDDELDIEGEEQTQEPQQPMPWRTPRERVASKKYPSHEWVTITEQGEPESYQEAIEKEKKNEWLKAMQEEMKSLHENQTYDIVKLPKGKKVLKNKWIFKVKNDGKNLRYKARLVVKGFGQRKGVDFDEIFSPVVKMSSIRVVLGMAASLNLEVEQLDVKTAFLHGDLEEEIYMEQPEGFETKEKEHYVCKLKKSLYGLKQAPRQWYYKFDSFMANHGYSKTTSDHCVFVKKFKDGNFIILLLYVDDMLVVGQDSSKIKELKLELSKSFAMKDLGPTKQILGMKIVRDREKGQIWLSQESYIEKVLERFNMHKAKPVGSPFANHFKLSSKQCPTSEKDKEEMKKVPYASAVGSLMYAMVCTRPDIAHAVGVVSRFLSNPGKEHWAAVKWILRYLRGTSKLCLCFGNNKPMLNGYTDSDMAGDIDSRKSTSGYLMEFAGGAVAWQSKLQKCVALSTTEAEFIAITEACKEILWLKKFLQELGMTQEKYVLHCDSQSAIHLSKNSTFHSRSKHIDVRYHWIRDVLESKSLLLEKIHTEDNPSDMMTKSVSKNKLEEFRTLTGLVDIST